MAGSAQDALETVREAVAEDRVEMTSHFEQRLGERGLLWVDLIALLDRPNRMEDQGLDVHGWPKWFIRGKTADELSAGVVVAIREDGRVRFITIHWEE